MLFDINSCCSICPSEILLNIDLEGELVYIFTEPDTGKQLPISEECCEIIGGKNLSQGDEYTGCDACVTYTQSNDLTNLRYGILDYQESTSIKLSDEILSTCCEKGGNHYYSGYPLGINNGAAGEYGNRCWTCPRVISEETDGVPYKIGDVINGRTIVNITPEYVGDRLSYYLIIFDDRSTSRDYPKNRLIYKPEDPSLGNNISEFCCSVIKRITGDRTIIYLDGVCTQYTKSLYE